VSSERLARSTKYAKLLLGCYRTGDANDPEVYTTAIVAILSDYPEHIQQTVTDPRGGLPSKVQWLPTPKEVRDACEVLHQRELRKAEWDARTKAQLEERARIDAVRLAPAKRQSWEEVKAELEAKGFTFGKKRQIETADQVMAKYGVSREAWDALPNLPAGFE